MAGFIVDKQIALPSDRWLSEFRGWRKRVGAERLLFAYLTSNITPRIGDTGFAWDGNEPVSSQLKLTSRLVVYACARRIEDDGKLIAVLLRRLDPSELPGALQMPPNRCQNYLHAAAAVCMTVWRPCWSPGRRRDHYLEQLQTCRLRVCRRLPEQLDRGVHIRRLCDVAACLGVVHLSPGACR